jgi:glucose-1-phosphate cytidylyltransferase
MKTLIFAGGYGTRISEITDRIPKPMIPIGKWPILVHILSHYTKYGIKDFVILGGYKQNIIRDFFDSTAGKELARKNSWNIEVVNTGEDTTTAGRLWAIRDKLPELFMLTYGDGLANVNVAELISTHERSGLIGTVTAVRPPARFGTIEFESGVVTSFREKDPQKTGWINGGFFCLNRSVIEFITDTSLSFESTALESLTAAGQLAAYPHQGFWHPMDTLRDMRSLVDIYSSGKASWDTSALE